MRCDAVQVAAVAALRQEHRLTFGAADARMIEVDVDRRAPICSFTAFLRSWKPMRNGPRAMTPGT